MKNFLNIFYLFLIVMCSSPVFSQKTKPDIFPSIVLTPEEREWLKEHPVIRASNEGDWPPFNIKKGEEVTGYCVDYLNLVAAKAGIKIEYVNAAWDKLLLMAKKKQLDVMTDVVKTVDRSKYLLFTEKYIDNPSGIYVNSSRRDIRSIEDLRQGKKVSVGKGYMHEEVIRKLYPEMTLVPVLNPSEGLEAVSVGRVDAHIGATASCNYYTWVCT